MPMLTTVNPLLDRMMSTRFLPMSWHVALDGGEHDRALALLVGLLHVRLEPGDRGLHDLGRLQHERQLHLALAEQLADDLHASEQVVVDDVERRAAVSSAS
jgi:hypothetical protein